MNHNNYNFTLPDAPQRIVCLTEEPTEILYALGEQHRIVGISAYTVRPTHAKDNHPVVSAFIGGSIKKIKALQPDLIIGFSDIQAQLAHDLIKENLPVVIFNQRSIQEILDTIIMIGSIVGARQRAQDLVKNYINDLQDAQQRAQHMAYHPKVYFEEWDDPLICSIQWVHELIEIVGGINVFAHKSTGKLASERFVSHQDILTANPDIILASWCGKPVDINAITSREGYHNITAVKDNQIHEIDPSIILQPGPAALSDGLKTFQQLISSYTPSPQTNGP